MPFIFAIKRELSLYRSFELVAFMDMFAKFASSILVVTCLVPTLVIIDDIIFVFNLFMRGNDTKIKQRVVIYSWHIRCRNILKVHLKNEIAHTGNLYGKISDKNVSFPYMTRTFVITYNLLYSSGAFPDNDK